MQNIISKKSIGDRLRFLRTSGKLSQAEVSEVFGISRSHYSQVELGKQFPTYEVLSRIAEFYNRSYDWILHGGELDGSISKLGKDRGKAIKPGEMVNSSNGCHIPLVRSSEFIVYACQHADSNYISALPSIFLPFPSLSFGRLRAFHVEGEFFDFQLYNQDIVIGEMVEDWLRIVILRLYVFVASGRLFLARISSYDHSAKEYEVVIGDTSSRVSLASINELWEVKGKISFRLGMANEQPGQLQDLMQSLGELRSELSRLK